jgi:PAS domain S-box-containing protein
MKQPQDQPFLQKKIIELEAELASFRKDKIVFHNLFEAILFGIQEIDPKGIILYANAALCRILGYSEGELLGKSIMDFLPTQPDREELRDYLDFLVREQPAPTPWAAVNLRKDGVRVDLKVDWNYKRDRDGNVIGFISLVTDITEKRKMLEVLRKSQKNFQSIFEHSPLPIMSTDAVGVITACNASATKLFEASEEKLVGFPLLEIKNEKMLGAVTAALAGNKSSFEGQYETMAGNVLLQLKAHFSPAFNEDGSISGVIGIFEDFSERRKAEQALKESEEKYSKIFNNEIDAIVLLDGATRALIDANKAFLKLYGYTRKEALQLKAEDISAEPEKTVATVKRSVREGDMRIKRRIHRKKNSEEIVVDIATFPILLQGKKVVFLRIQDITEHVRAEKELQELQERFRIAFNTSPDAINITRLDGTYVEINKGFTRLTGYTREDVIGKTSLELEIWENPWDRVRLVKGLRQDGHVINLEANFRMKDGSAKTALMSANLIFLNGQEHILSITRDITDLKKAERDKEELETQLRQVYKMEAIGTMAGGIAHDFNNILTIILGNADLARHAAGEVSGPLSDYLKQIQSASVRAKEMVRQILTFSRRTQQDLRVIKPHMVFSEAFKLLRSTIPTSVEMQLELSPECPAILADTTQLNQLLMNLCTNAVDAMDEKGQLRITLNKITLDKNNTRHRDDLAPGPYVLLSVTDTGKGMTRDVQERIFDPFFTTKKVGSGTGMGLSVVHGVVESHGGMIQVKSMPGRGTTVHVYFPAAAEAREQASNKEPGRKKGNEHILFVDDEERLAELAGEILELHGYQVTIRTSSTEALETFSASPESFDLVITDQTMPKMTGAELSAALLKIMPDLPVILCTGYSSKISAATARKIGIADFSMKPFDMEQLVRTVRTVLDRRTSRLDIGEKRPTEAVPPAM